AIASAQSAPPIKSAEVIELVKHSARRGGLIAGWGKGPRNAKVVIVSRGGDRPEVRRLIDAATAAGRRRRGEGEARPAPIPKAGRTLHPIGEGMNWGVEKGDRVLSDAPDAILAVLDGQQPSAVDHPVRAGLYHSGDGFQPVAAGFVDITALPPMPPQATQIG